MCYTVVVIISRYIIAYPWNTALVLIGASF